MSLFKSMNGVIVKCEHQKQFQKTQDILVLPSKRGHQKAMQNCRRPKAYHFVMELWNDGKQRPLQ